jgi:hypothetical protein
MPNEPTSYTPAQYLEAGYRAEQAGDRDRAAQYYVYVAEAFPETPEGEAARGGLVRIGVGARTEPQHTTAQPTTARAQPQAHPVTPHAADHPVTIGTARTTTQPARPAAHDYDGKPHTQPAHQNAAPAPAAPGYAQPTAVAGANQQRIALGDLARLKLAQGTAQPATKPHTGPQAGPQQTPAAHPDSQHDHADAAHHEPMRLPDVVTRRARELAEADAYAPPPKYRGGRLMARLFVWLGWLTVAGGIAEIVLALMFGGPANLGLGVAVAGLLGLVAIVSGLLMVLVGQLSLAVFDGSNAVREIAAIMRARSDL